MENLIQVLKKRRETTPYNYQEYEILRGKHALPYLIDKYRYKSFFEFNHHLELQYNEMPDCFKNRLSVNENGIITILRQDNAINEFFAKKK